MARVRIETVGRLVELDDPDMGAEQLAALARKLWPLTRGGHRTPMGFAASAAGSSHERRPTPNHDRTRRGPGPHRMPNDPSATTEDPQCASR